MKWLQVEALFIQEIEMIELNQTDVLRVSGGNVDWEQIGVGLAMVGLGVAIVGTAGLATVPVALVGAATLGEVTVGLVGVGLAGVGGFSAGGALAAPNDDMKEAATTDE